MRTKNLFPMAAVLFGTLLCGCSTVTEMPDEDYGHVKFKRPDKVVYEQISARDCQLAVPEEVQAVAGTSCDLEVQLINYGRKEIVIKEWYMIDQYNFAVFYRKIPADRPLDNKMPFKKYAVRIPAKPLPKHAELRINPSNRAVLNITMPFTGELNPGENAAYEVIVATSLNTFKIRSKKFMVYAR
ncbi:MAG: hypothetical protein E7056_07000 [Lentisphaerae bacterium]|nr:hypothetical protein [Lentisphaerota bacterium]